MIDNFDSCIKFFINSVFEVKDNLYKSENAPLWVSWFTQFSKAYSKASSSSGNDKFKQGFIDFFNEHISDFSQPIFSSEDTKKVNADWIKNEGYIPFPGSESIDLKCKGHIIFFSKNPKHYSISIPISDIYRDSIKVSKNSEGRNPYLTVLPAKILLGLLSSIKFSIPSIYDEKKIVENNVDLLKDYLDLDFKETKPNTFGGISKIVGQITKSAGIEGFNQSAIEDGLGKILSDENLSSIGKVLSGVSKSISENVGKDKNIGDIIDSFGKSIQSSSVKDEIVNIMNRTKSANSELVKSIPTSEEQEFDGDPTDQD